MATLKAVIKDTNSLLEFYYSVGGLLSIKVTPSNALYLDTSLLLLLMGSWLLLYVLNWILCGN